jgi:hypothetical protein
MLDVVLAQLLHAMRALTNTIESIAPAAAVASSFDRFQIAPVHANMKSPHVSADFIFELILVPRVSDFDRLK